MNDNAAQNTPQRRFIMATKFNFVRRFTEQVQHVARLVAFDFDVDVDVTEEEIFEELQTRSYRVA
jgi:hypothetical protein